MKSKIKKAKLFIGTVDGETAYDLMEMDIISMIVKDKNIGNIPIDTHVVLTNTMHNLEVIGIYESSSNETITDLIKDDELIPVLEEVKENNNVMYILEDGETLSLKELIADKIQKENISANYIKK